MATCLAAFLWEGVRGRKPGYFKLKKNQEVICFETENKQRERERERERAENL